MIYYVHQTLEIANSFFFLSGVDAIGNLFLTRRRVFAFFTKIEIVKMKKKPRRVLSNRHREGISGEKRVFKYSLRFLKFFFHFLVPIYMNQCK